jgi:hypothetical protein
MQAIICHRHPRQVVFEATTYEARQPMLTSGSLPPHGSRRYRQSSRIHPTCPHNTNARFNHLLSIPLQTRTPRHTREGHKSLNASAFLSSTSVVLDALPTLLFDFISTHFEPTQRNTHFDTDFSTQVARMRDPIISRILEDVQHRRC